MGWRILYIDQGEYLSLYLDNIKMTNKKKDKELIIPIKDIHTMIIDNYQSVLSVHLMNALARYNVNVVLCSIDHMPHTLIIPHKGNNQAPMMLRKQLKWQEQMKRVVHQAIVKAKIRNQIDLLIHCACDKSIIDKLVSFKDDVTLGDKTNREGLVSKMYFRALFGSDFKRFEEDTINAALNYGYSILRSQISKTVIAKGLNPSIAFFHHGPNNHFNLSDDFIEPFRPLIDHYVYHHLCEEKMLKREHKLALIKQTTKQVRIKGINQTFFNAVNQYVDLIVDFSETGELNKLHHPIFDFDAL